MLLLGIISVLDAEHLLLLSILSFGHGNTNCNRCTCYSHQMMGTWTGGLGHKRTSEDHPNYSIVKIGQYTEKSPEDLRRLAITQTPVKNSQVSKIIKQCKGENPGRYIPGSCTQFVIVMMPFNHILREYRRDFKLHK